MIAGRRHIGALFALQFLVAVVACFAQVSKGGGIESTTADRLREPGWWPTKRTASREDFIGSEACERCHRGFKIQESTPMAQASSPANEAEILRTHGALEFLDAPYSSQIVTTPAGSSYCVSNGQQNICLPTGWAFGEGEAGQTYVLKKGKVFLESRVSFYKTLGNLAITTGHSSSPPKDIESALGSALTLEDAQRCFGCHTTAASTAEGFDPQHAVPGVTCEACHGPGQLHASAGEMITNPGTMSPVDLVDFCGACHRTWLDVAFTPPGDLGMIGIRFQPYRLEMSRCWGKNGDPRITCIACHDPHQPLQHDSAYYDLRCLQCHGTASRLQARMPVRSCPVATKGCVTCHMPKYEVPGLHSAYTDHFIRIVRKGEPYPE